MTMIITSISKLAMQIPINEQYLSTLKQLVNPQRLLILKQMLINSKYTETDQLSLDIIKTSDPEFDYSDLKMEAIGQFKLQMKIGHLI